MLIKTGILWGLGVGGVGDWVGVSERGGGFGLGILLKLKPILKPQNLSGNPFKNQAKKKVSKSQIITKTSKFGLKSF